MIGKLTEFVNFINKDMDLIMNNNFITILLLAFLIIATYTDIKDMKIYDKFNIIFLITRIILNFIPIVGIKLTTNHLVGGVAGFMFLLIPAMALMHQMGGDIKFVGILGLYLGVHIIIPFLTIACLYNLVYLLLINKKNKSKACIPFAPFFLLSFVTLIVLNSI